MRGRDGGITDGAAGLYLLSLFCLHNKMISVKLRSIFIDKQEKEKMDGVVAPRDLQDALNKLFRQGMKIPSEEVNGLVKFIAGIDSSDTHLPGLIDMASRLLSQNQDFSEHLTTLFAKAVSVPTSPILGERLIQRLFYANPDVLAEPLIDFVRGAPMGPRQTELLRDIFNPRSLLRDAVECYPPESHDQKVWGLKSAAAGIDNLRAQKGFGDIVECVVDSVKLQKRANQCYGALFHA